MRVELTLSLLTMNTSLTHDVKDFQKVLKSIY